MTSTEFAALKMTIPGAMPFAGAVTDTSPTEPGLIVPGASTGAFSMPEGFGSTFDAAPTANGSNMVQRGQINYIGKMASYAPFMGKVGRDYFEFDPAVATAPANSRYGIGGYPKGAILTLVKDGCYLKIISLVENNKVDYTAQTDTTQYADVINGSVDGVNWQYLSLDPQTLIDQSVVAEIPKTTFTGNLSQPLNVFKASNTTALVVEGGLECETDKPVQVAGETVRDYYWHVCLVVSPPKNSLDDLANWVPGATMSGTGADTVIYKTGGSDDTASAQIQVKTVITTPGKYYGIGLIGHAWAPTTTVSGNWSLRVAISASTVKVHLKVV